MDRTERHTNYPNLLRLLSLIHYLLLAFHWNACLFHVVTNRISREEETKRDFTTGANSVPNEHQNSTHSTFSSTNHRSKLWRIKTSESSEENSSDDVNHIMMEYLTSYYWTVLTMSTIGDLPTPQTKSEFVFLIFELIIGLLTFAAVLGYVASIVAHVSSERKDFQSRLDGVKTYMRVRRVPQQLQNKVIRWFDYLWFNKICSVDEDKFTTCLPDKLKSEIAIHVHLETLRRVEIFQNTEAGFLCDLILRLRPVLYSPGDYICRKGEVGKEMYICNRGRLEVVADDGYSILATLKSGSYFGEISILNMGTAGNKRTASVRSVGYSNLFVLSKKDMWDVLKDYPAARVRLESIAVRRLQKYNRAPLLKAAMSRSDSTPGLVESRAIISLYDMWVSPATTAATPLPLAPRFLSRTSPSLQTGGVGDVLLHNYHHNEETAQHIYYSSSLTTSSHSQRSSSITAATPNWNGGGGGLRKTENSRLSSPKFAPQNACKLSNATTTETANKQNSYCERLSNNISTRLKVNASTSPSSNLTKIANDDEKNVIYSVEEHRDGNDGHKRQRTCGTSLLSSDPTRTLAQEGMDHQCLCSGDCHRRPKSGGEHCLTKNESSDTCRSRQFSESVVGGPDDSCSQPHLHKYFTSTDLCEWSSSERKKEISRQSTCDGRGDDVTTLPISHSITPVNDDYQLSACGSSRHQVNPMSNPISIHTCTASRVLSHSENLCEYANNKKVEIEDEDVDASLTMDTTALKDEIMELQLAVKSLQEENAEMRSHLTLHFASNNNNKSRSMSRDFNNDQSSNTSHEFISNSTVNNEHHHHHRQHQHPHLPYYKNWKPKKSSTFIHSICVKDKNGNVPKMLSSSHAGKTTSNRSTTLNDRNNMSTGGGDCKTDNLVISVRGSSDDLNSNFHESSTALLDFSHEESFI